MQHDANYIEERLIKPLQQAVNVIREADKLALLIKQRQGTVKELMATEDALKRQHAQQQAAIASAKEQAASQRQELQAQLSEERRARDAERRAFEQERERLKAQQREEQARMGTLQRERLQAEEELALIKADIATRLDSLQKVAR